MDFEQAWLLTMTWEGGGRLHEVEGDPGGATRFGISQRAHPEVDVATMSRGTAKAIARLEYWNKVRADDVGEGVRWQLFDTAFNQGPWIAAVLLQRSLNVCRMARNGPLRLLEEDGNIGPLTLAAAQQENSWRLGLVYKAYRIEHYITLAETGRAKFIHGWLRRAGGEVNG